MTFAEFYPYYLTQHADRRCRRAHFIGSTSALRRWRGSRHLQCVVGAGRARVRLRRGLDRAFLL
jgi:hypothetical protein